MLVTSKSLSLIEQKRLQWAKEREEMIGLCGLWGRPKNSDSKENKEDLNYNRNSLLPPIQASISPEHIPKEQFRQAEESETSGYLSDSPKHANEVNITNSYNGTVNHDEQLNNKEPTQHFWSDVDKSTNNLPEKTMYKNFKNENWAHQNSDLVSRHNHKAYDANKNFWYGTPDSVSSDEGSRLRWGDRGVGIGHLWEPVINVPDCRLPQVVDPYRQTPKWVEKGLKNADGKTADILIIHHPDDVHYDQRQKNFILGQNAPIPPEIIMEREKKRRKALEHQNAIKKQLEERELKRKLEKENRIKEERLEEERIRKEQEIERLRYEEEKRKIKEKEEMERKKEEAMKEAIKEAEKRAKEEKKRNRYLSSEANHKNYSEIEKDETLGNVMHQNETNAINVIKNADSPKYKKREENEYKIIKQDTEKSLKDSSSQFEEIQLANNFQLLNVNGLPIDGGLALMLENSPKDNILLPPDGVQLALLMSPRNPISTTQRLPPSPDSICLTSEERILTPSKYRITERKRYYPRNKSTQTESKFSWVKSLESGKTRKQSGSHSSSSIVSQKHITLDRHHKHIRCFIASKYRCKPNPSKITLEDRPKWGINRPSVEYKKQSEKDLCYHRKIKERTKKASANRIPSAQAVTKAKITGNDIKEKELDSVVRLLNCQTKEKEKSEKFKEEIVLKNGYRMSSNLSSPVFVPIKSRFMGELEELKKFYGSKESSSKSLSVDKNEIINKEEVIPKTGSVGFLTQSQLDAIRQITNLREGLKKLQKDYSHSRSTTPFSDISVEK